MQLTSYAMGMGSYGMDMDCTYRTITEFSRWSVGMMKVRNTYLHKLGFIILSHSIFFPFPIIIYLVVVKVGQSTIMASVDYQPII